MRSKDESHVSFFHWTEGTEPSGGNVMENALFDPVRVKSSVSPVSNSMAKMVR